VVLRGGVLLEGSEWHTHLNTLMPSMPDVMINHGNVKAGDNAIRWERSEVEKGGPVGKGYRES